MDNARFNAADSLLHKQLTATLAYVINIGIQTDESAMTTLEC